MTKDIIKDDLYQYANPQKAEILQRFFKTGPGQYGEGDVFWGIQVPVLRDFIKSYKGIPLEAIVELLHDPVHEIRMAGAFIMVDSFRKSKGNQKKEVFDCYMDNATCFNNWDLVDLTCPEIAGKWLIDKDRSILYQFAQSENLWKQRISIISTLSFIKKNDFEDTFKIAMILLNHKHDLIHKAVGWMLREAGKRNHEAECDFLLENDKYKKMPRTMLRYAIEKFPEEERQFYMRK